MQLLSLISFGLACTTGQYFEVTYPASTHTNELTLGVTYRLWVPNGARTLRGVIVHQHGCGVGSNQGAVTAAQDLHWQALAKKWNCALLGPSYHQGEKDNCRLWCDPRNGSHKTFLRCLSDFAAITRHPELEDAPWCLWGHSGGGFWSSIMQTMYPERIVAIWFRSGTAFATWEKGDIPKPTISTAALAVPAMCNPGVKENGDKRFGGAWTGSLEMFRAYRAQAAPIGFAPDPRTSHETGDSRYLAIPFFDACLAMRLPDRVGQPLKPVDTKQAWYAELLSEEARPAAKFTGDLKQAVWLPNERVAKAWLEYVRLGATSDTTPPPAPTNVRVSAAGELTWNAEADFESGLQTFIIQRDGKDFAKWPEKPSGKFGRPLFQGMSYGDTPEKPVREMKFTDTTAKPGERHAYSVIAVNSVGLCSKPIAAR
jgi:poly(3-hydroxybutyrate) depolymerase